MDFVNRHLPDKFYLQSDQRISLRATIFREIAANLIIHREYINAAPATFVIYADRVETENDTVNDTINDSAKNRLIEVIKLVLEKPGMKINDLIEKLNVSERTAKRDLEKIRGLVEYRGSKKTGGYFLTDYMLSKLNTWAKT